MQEKGIYEKLADHLSKQPMGLVSCSELIEILRESLTPQEATVAMALPNKVVPLEFADIDEIPTVGGLSREEMVEVLENLSQRGIVFTGKTRTGKKGYALWQSGFGFPQVFHWKGEDTPQARKMAELYYKYNKNPEVSKDRTNFQDPKPYRYIPIAKSIDVAKQGVYSQHMMEEAIGNAGAFAVTHCPCRVKHAMVEEGCDHPTEVCLKFNDMAEFLIEKGFARKITRDEALEIIQKSADAGLVHFVDNAGGDIQHNCNCCGCACWNVGPIKRRLAPRDAIMATYFIRETDEDECIGCGDCVDICPVEAVKMDDDKPVVDLEWCIGCGVCSNPCPVDAIRMTLRPDRTGQLPAESFRGLHELILENKGLA